MPTENHIQAEATKPRGRRFGCLLIIVSAIAVITLAVSLSYFIWYSHARSQLDTEIARIQSRGEPLMFRELAPKDSNPDLNGSTVYMLALAKMQSPSQAFNNLVTADPPKPPSEDPILIAELAKNREVLDLLAEAMRRPTFRLPIDYETKAPFSIVLEPVQGARDMTRLLAGAVTVAIAAGDHASAVETIQRMLDLSELLREEPFVISQLIRIAIGSVALASLEQALAQMDLTDAQAEALDKQIATIESRFTLVPAILAERASVFTTLTYLSENSNLWGLVSDGESEPSAVAYAGQIKPNLMADQAFMLKTMSDLAEIIDMPGPQGAAAIDEIQARVQNAPLRFVYTRLLMPSMGPVREAGIRFRQKLCNARLGIRIDRYYATHGRFPTSLVEIVDNRLEKIPADLFAAKPLVYRVIPEGFEIYSVGPNGKDDGGGARPDHIENGTKFDVQYPHLVPLDDAPATP